MSSGRKTTSAEEVVVRTHEVGIAGDHGLRVQPGENLGEELLGLAGRRAGVDVVAEGKLGDPDTLEALLGSERDGLVDEGLELLGGVTVPVHGEGADAAVGAGLQESVHPVQAFAGRTAVGDTGGNQLGLAAVGGDVLLVGLRGLGGGHGGLGAVVGLVEAQNVLAAAGKRRLDG